MNYIVRVMFVWFPECFETIKILERSLLLEREGETNKHNSANERHEPISMAWTVVGLMYEPDVGTPTMPN